MIVPPPCLIVLLTCTIACVCGLTTRQYLAPIAFSLAPSNLITIPLPPNYPSTLFLIETYLPQQPPHSYPLAHILSASTTITDTPCAPPCNNTVYDEHAFVTRSNAAYLLVNTSTTLYVTVRNHRTSDPLLSLLSSTTIQGSIYVIAYDAIALSSSSTFLSASQAPCPGAARNDTCSSQGSCDVSAGFFEPVCSCKSMHIGRSCDVAVQRAPKAKANPRWDAAETTAPRPLLYSSVLSLKPGVTTVQWKTRAVAIRSGGSERVEVRVRMLEGGVVFDGVVRREGNEGGVFRMAVTTVSDGRVPTVAEEANNSVHVVAQRNGDQTFYEVVYVGEARGEDWWVGMFVVGSGVNVSVRVRGCGDDDSVLGMCLGEAKTVPWGVVMGIVATVAVVVVVCVVFLVMRCVRRNEESEALRRKRAGLLRKKREKVGESSVWSSVEGFND